MKIIPAIDLMDGKVVRLVRGKPKQKTVYSDNPLAVAKKWEAAGADMIHIVDLDAALNQGSNLQVIRKVVRGLSIPVQVAGGLRNESTISDVLKFASRIVVGTLAFTNKPILKKLAEKFNTTQLVISVDHVNGIIVINGWQKSTGVKLLDGIKDFIKWGFSEYLLTNVDRDGTLRGPDLDFLRKACSINGVRIIASGGISSINDVLEVKKANAYGVVLGKALYENKISIEEAKKIS